MTSRASGCASSAATARFTPSSPAIARRVRGRSQSSRDRERLRVVCAAAAVAQANNASDDERIATALDSVTARGSRACRFPSVAAGARRAARSSPTCGSDQVPVTLYSNETSCSSGSFRIFCARNIATPATGPPISAPAMETLSVKMRRSRAPQLLRLAREVDVARHHDARRRPLDAEVLGVRDAAIDLERADDAVERETLR